MHDKYIFSYVHRNVRELAFNIHNKIKQRFIIIIFTNLGIEYII